MSEHIKKEHSAGKEAAGATLAVGSALKRLLRLIGHPVGTVIDAAMHNPVTRKLSAVTAGIRKKSGRIIANTDIGKSIGVEWDHNIHGVENGPAVFGDDVFITRTRGEIELIMRLLESGKLKSDELKDVLENLREQLHSDTTTDEHSPGELRRLADVIGSHPDECLEAAEKMAKLFQSNLSSVLIGVRKQFDTLLQSAGLQNISLSESLDQRLPLWNLSEYGAVGSSLLYIFFYTYMGLYGDTSPSEFLRWLHAQAAKIPELAQQILSVVNASIPARVSKEVPMESVVWGILATYHSVRSIALGLFPWRPDQTRSKNWKAERAETIKTGTKPFGTHEYRNDSETRAGQTIFFGPRDALTVAEIDDGRTGRQRSFLAHLREQGSGGQGEQPLPGEVVPMQRDGTSYDPENLGVSFNDDGIFVNLDVFVGRGKQVVDAIGHVMVSGGHKAQRVIINTQRGFQLFASAIVDTQGESKLPVDIAMVHHFLRQLMLLRKMLFSKAPDLEVVLVLPKHVAQLERNLDQSEPWESVFKSQIESLGSLGGIKIHEPIIPEHVFIEQVQEKIQQRGLESAAVYVNAEGQTDSGGKEKRCKEALHKVGICIEDDPSKATVCVMLRGQNRETDQSSRVLSELYGNIKLFICPTDARSGDPIDHIQADPMQQKRVAAPFKQRIATHILDLLGFSAKEAS